jgi:hypothetical protein
LYQNPILPPLLQGIVLHPHLMPETWPRSTNKICPDRTRANIDNYHDQCVKRSMLTSETGPWLPPKPVQAFQ